MHTMLSKCLSTLDLYLFNPFEIAIKILLRNANKEEARVRNDSRNKNCRFRTHGIFKIAPENSVEKKISKVG